MVRLRLDECCTLEKGNTPIQKAVPGPYPMVVTAAARKTCDSYQFDAPSVCIPLVSSRGHGVASLNQVYYQEGKFALGNILCGVTPKDSKILNAKFLSYYLNFAKDWLIVPLMTGGANVSLTVKTLGKVKVFIPKIEEQQRIVEILDKFTSLVSSLDSEIALRQKQYEYYRDKLVSEVEGTKGVLLDMLCQPVTDGPHESPKFYDYGIPFISVDAIEDNKINFERKRGYISEEYDLQCRLKYSPQKNDVYIVKSGSTVGKVAIVETDERFNIWSPLAAMRVNSENCPKYLYYLLLTKAMQDQVKEKCSKGSQPNLSMRVLEKFAVTIPPLPLQQRIVRTLDLFESLLSNLKKERELRQKQYEYYREKLLTFA